MIAVEYLIGYFVLFWTIVLFKNAFGDDNPPGTKTKTRWYTDRKGRKRKY